jgi:tRNA-specific 2-thiouridylase
MKTVYVGLSGGVDSSVSALLLKQQGYNVVGVYMKNWSQDLPGMPCPWMDDYQDAKRIAVQLGIEFKMYNFENEYRHKVVDYMLEALERTLFPLGGLTKPQVREVAKKNNLVTATKKESMGICFVGKVGIKEFLQQYVLSSHGKIINQNGKEIGTHEGAIFYTIGQRHGLEVGGGLPCYVVGKNMKKNEVYVTSDLQDGKLWSNKIHLTSAHWINDEPKQGQELELRMRHRGKLIKVNQLSKIGKSEWQAELADDVRALTPGQSVVFYSDSECLGGGIITGV